jgi:hypothetical protein
MRLYVWLYKPNPQQNFKACLGSQKARFRHPLFLEKCIFALANLRNSLTMLAAFFPESDHLLAPSKTTCDITLKHVLSAKSSL